MKATPLEVAESAEIVSLHIALKPETRNLIDEKFLAAMRNGSFLINTSRGEVVNEAALSKAVSDGRIRAALDVFAGEPSASTGTVDNPLVKLAGVIGTHHIGASTDQAQAAIADETIRIIREYKQTGRAPNVVNLATKTPATHLLVVRHLDRIGVLAGVFDQLKAAGINVQETENIVFEGAHAAVARIALDQPPSASVLDEMRSRSDAIIDASLVAL
jgi:D-3-phosphoglycerate dehydrogenase